MMNLNTVLNRACREARITALLVSLVVWVFFPNQLRAQSNIAPTEPPAHWGAVSINLEDVPYPYPVHFLNRNLFGQDIRIAYMDVAPVGQSNGQVVVLLHGSSYYGWYWEHSIDALSKEGFRVVTIDRLGWGRSSKPIIPYSLNLHASNTRAILDHLGVDKAAIVGHSLGGKMASRFVFLYPEVATHLVMVNPIGITDNREGREWREPSSGNVTPDLQQVYESNLRTEQRRIVNWDNKYLEHVRIRYGLTLSGEWPRLALVRSLNGSASSIDTIVHDWPQMETKALVIGGELDGPTFPERARNVAESLANAGLVLLPNAAHNPHVEIPDVFNPELIRFLKSDPNVPASEGW